MVELKIFDAYDIPDLLSWIRGTDKKFLIQFAGPLYKYPLDEDQLNEEINKMKFQKDMYMFKAVDSATGEPVGHCQLLKIDYFKKKANIGKVLIKPDARKNRYGFYMLKELMIHAFDKLDMEALYLNVFDFNIPAYNLYRKLGFQEEERMDQYLDGINETWKRIVMKTYNEAFKKIIQS